MCFLGVLLLGGLALSPLRAQTVTFQGLITTVAGNGTQGYSGDGGPATSAELGGPYDVAVDSAGNLYIADLMNDRIRKVTPGGTITTVAGNGTYGYSGDGGPATSAELYNPDAVAVDGSGNLYIADYSNSVIRKVTPGGTITTVAGNGTLGYSGDGGPATSAELYGPYGVAVDGAGNLYIADNGNNRIRTVTPGGTITTVAGNGTQGYSGDGGPATSAELYGPSGVAVDGAGNLYIADWGNNRIRTVTPGGTITTVAGNGTGGYSGDGGPATSAELLPPSGVAVDGAGNLYIVDEYNYRIRKVTPGGTITTVAGNGGGGYSGDGGPATSAELFYPVGVAVDGSGNLYIADSDNYRIRKVQTSSVDFGSENVGQTSAAYSLGFSFGGTVQVGSVAVLTQGASGLDFQQAAGSTCAAGSYSDGSTCTVNVTFAPLAPGARLGAVVLYDTSTPANALATVRISGTGVGPAIAFDPGIISTAAGNGTSGYSGDGGPATSAELADPVGPVVDGAGNLYIADENNDRIRKVTPGGTITTVAGNGTYGYSGDGGPATSAELHSPAGVVVDGAGNLYIADSSNNRIRKVTPGGTITTVAGDGTGGYSGDGGPATSAELRFPYGVAVDGAGNLYIADTFNQRIRKVTPDGTITTVAGDGTEGYSGDGGPATSAELSVPVGVAVDGAGNLYIVDNGDQRIRKVTPGGTITTVAGNGTEGYSGDGGPATSAELYYPAGVVVDGAGNLYIADQENNRIRKVTPGGTITTVAGNGTEGYSGDGGPATSAELFGPLGVAVDGAGNLYIADTFNQRIRKVDVSDAPSFTFLTTNVGDASPAQDVTLLNLGNAPLTFPVPGAGENPSVSANFTLDGTTTCPEVTTSSSAGTLAAGASCVLAVDFIPATTGPISGSVVLTDDTLNVANSMQNIGLSGTGVAATLITPTVTVSPSSSSITTAQSLSVTVTVSGGNGNPTPTGSVTLSSGSYTSAATALSAGSATITVPAGSLAVGNDTLTATYIPDAGSSSTYNSATGSAPVTVVQAIGSCATSNPNPNPNPVSFAAVRDFNGDCRSDILWRNTSTQQVYEWFMNGTTYPSSGTPGSPASDWVIQGAGDFNGDGKADILWRNSTTGEVFIWIMNGSTFTSSGSLGYVSSDWTIKGVGDFNGDGKADILWRNSTTGQVYLWQMNGITVAGGGSVTYITSDWVIQGIGDFNGDGKADILWRNTTTGEVYIWLMNGNTLTSSGSLGSVSSDWSIAGVGDFNGDGKSDILWWNSTSGQIYIWFINGTTTASTGSVGSVSSGWNIQGVGDYDGSGRAGILWRNSTTEQVYVWLMNGTTLTSSGSPGAPSATWLIAP